ncbi:MAG: tryptophan--tRNA ligase [Bdellovibrionaceae bacterium]|nr:tryptophan--tRNA ligase [Pseudobdellovibrionaceae bacterium]|tara:strand:+ start:177 stop:1190 length:1014 start_codon:yes stop_codon:yes gene_type:complete
MKEKQVVLTGVKPTGMPHLGNYWGAIRPAIDMANSANSSESWLFIADYHSLTALNKAEELSAMVYEVAATWLACGLDPSRTTIYRQSDIPEILELNWILSCVCPKGLMNRAHAYKAKVQENEELKREDVDFGVNMGLYNYPILMSADILLFDATHVPVGPDQVQHIEIARDLAEKFNRIYGEHLTLPKAKLMEGLEVVPGMDGRKMSKSYDNHIPLFDAPKKRRKRVMKIVTDSSPPEEPKDYKNSLLFDMYKLFASPQQVEEMKQKYQKGIGWGYVKQDLDDVLETHLAPMREKYEHFMSHKEEVDQILKQGAEKARPKASEKIKTLRKAIGLVNE